MLLLFLVRAHIQIRAFKSFILWCCSPALSSAQNKRVTKGDSQTPVWHRMAAEIVDTVTDRDRRKCVCSSVLHHFSISLTVSPYLYVSVGGKRKKTSQRHVKQRCQKLTKPCMNFTNSIASLAASVGQISHHPQLWQVSSSCYTVEICSRFSALMKKIVEILLSMLHLQWLVELTLHSVVFCWVSCHVGFTVNTSTWLENCSLKAVDCAENSLEENQMLKKVFEDNKTKWKIYTLTDRNQNDQLLQQKQSDVRCDLPFLDWFPEEVQTSEL